MSITFDPAALPRAVLCFLVRASIGPHRTDCSTGSFFDNKDGSLSGVNLLKDSLPIPAAPGNTNGTGGH